MRPNGFDRFIHERVNFGLGTAGKRLREIAAKVLELFIKFAQSVEHANVNQRGHRFPRLGDDNSPMPILDLIEQFSQPLPHGHCRSFANHE